MADDFDRDLRRIFVQLIEARQDQNDAERRLQEYRAANTPPASPAEFSGVDALLDYHHRRQDYETHLGRREKALKRAKKEYADASDQLKLFMADEVPLHYAYEGERGGLTGKEYVIVRKQDEIVVESPSTAES